MDKVMNIVAEAGLSLEERNSPALVFPFAASGLDDSTYNTVEASAIACMFPTDKQGNVTPGALKAAAKAAAKLRRAGVERSDAKHLFRLAIQHSMAEGADFAMAAQSK